MSCTSTVDYNIWHKNYVFHELPVSSPQETSIDQSKDSEYCEDAEDSEYSEDTGGDAVLVGNTVVVDNPALAIMEVVLLCILKLDVLDNGSIPVPDSDTIYTIKQQHIDKRSSMLYT